MAWHSDEAVENNLRKCYEVDIDWDLVPKKLQDVSIHCFLTITAQWLCVSSIFSSNYCLNIIFFLYYNSFVNSGAKPWSNAKLLFYLASCLLFLSCWGTHHFMSKMVGKNLLSCGWLSCSKQVFRFQRFFIPLFANIDNVVCLVGPV